MRRIHAAVGRAAVSCTLEREAGVRRAAGIGGRDELEVAAGQIANRHGQGQAGDIDAVVLQDAAGGQRGDLHGRQRVGAGGVDRIEGGRRGEAKVVVLASKTRGVFSVVGTELSAPCGGLFTLATLTVIVWALAADSRSTPPLAVPPLSCSWKVKLVKAGPNRFGLGAELQRAAVIAAAETSWPTVSGLPPSVSAPRGRLERRGSAPRLACWDRSRACSAASDRSDR